MSTKRKKHHKLNTSGLNIGNKINLLTYSLVLFSVILISVTCYVFYRKVLIESTYLRLEEIGNAKTREVETNFNNTIKHLSEFGASAQMSRIATHLNNSFFDYKEEILTDPNAAYYSMLDDYKKFITESYLNDNKAAFGKNPPTEEDMPSTEFEIVFQSVYYLENPYPIHEKYKMRDYSDATTYAKYHLLYHHLFTNKMQNMSINDFYIVDIESGIITYNTRKNLTLGSDLYEGRFSDTKLGLTFKQVVSNDNKSYVHIEDFKEFLPAFNANSLFVGVPVFDGNKKIAVLIAEINQDYIYANLYNSRDSYQYNSINFDIWCNAMYLFNPALDEVNISSKSKNISNKPTKQELTENKLRQEQNINGIKAKLTNGKNFFKEKSALGKSSFHYANGINFGNLTWTIITNVDTYSALSPLRKIRLILLLVYIAIFAITFYLVQRFSEPLSSRLVKLKDALYLLFSGEKASDLSVSNKDELAVAEDTFNLLNSRMFEASDFALELSSGDYKNELQSVGNNDAFAHAMNTLKNTLVTNRTQQEKREEEDKINKWINDGITLFNDLLRQNNHDIGLLSDLIIENLVKYVDAVQGGMFMIIGDEESKKIELTAAHAYNRKKHLQKELNINDGLLGSCYKEQKYVHLSDLPEDYIEITSGLGRVVPRELIIVPLLTDEGVLGLFEIASLNKLQKHHIDFLLKVADNIAATFKTVQLNSRTSELLEESKRRANEITQQEEEMRQNMEEMLATQEELARLREEDEKRTNELQRTIAHQKTLFQDTVDSIEVEFFIKTEEGIIVYINDLAAKSFNSRKDDITGANVTEFMTPEQLAKDKETDESATFNNETSWFEDFEDEDEEARYKLTKKKFYIDTHETGGFLVTRMKA